MRSRRNRLTAMTSGHIIVGAIGGVFFLHPITMAIYWFEFHSKSDSGVGSFVMDRMLMAFVPAMLPMTAVFAVMGGIIGLGSALYSRSLIKKSQLIGRLAKELARDVSTLIEVGENDSVEFKSSLRWDEAQGHVNKNLEFTILKTLAGFMNRDGGDLLIGVRDDGHVLGLDHDYATLRKEDRDGFELLLMNLVRDRLGVSACELVEVVFHNLSGKDVCRVLVEAAHRPIYIEHKSKTHYFLRTGNATVELNVKEAHEHIQRRRKHHYS